MSFVRDLRKIAVVVGRGVVAPWRRWILIPAAEQTVHGEDEERYRVFFSFGWH